MSNQPEVTEESSVSKGKNMNSDSSSPRSHNQSEHSKPKSALAGWFHSVTNMKSSSSASSSSSAQKEERNEQSESTSSGGGLEAALYDAGRCGSDTSISKDTGINEEYQIQMAMQLSAKEDPEAVQIEAVKQISLGSYSHEIDPAEVAVSRYWNYNALTYEDKILDGFYDVYGVITESISSKMPSLVDLQGMPASEGVNWEAVLVNKRVDVNLLKLVGKAVVLANNAGSKHLSVSIELVEEIARLVANYMGGSVEDPGSMLRAWKSLVYNLRSTLKSLVLPLGSLTIGLARHRALLFKVLADSVGIPCQLVKGQQYTGSDEVAMNIIKIDDGREYIVDLMSDPGALIPCDGLGSHVEYEESLSSHSPLSRDVDSSTLGTSSGGAISSFEESLAFQTMYYKSRLKRQPNAGTEPGDNSHEDWKTDLLLENPPKVERLRVQELPAKGSYSHSHIRSPSWTEGVSTPAMQQMKMKDDSQIVIDAAKGNRQFAQKLQDALLESGVITPPNFFSGLNPEPSESLAEAKLQLEDKERNGKENEAKLSEPSCPHLLPPLPHRGEAHRIMPSAQQCQLDYHIATECSGEAKPNDVALYNQIDGMHNDGCSDSDEKKTGGFGEILEGERTPDRSSGTDSGKTEPYSVDCEILWQEITLGERIGLGAYGEVYRGDWHGTEVAVKRFLDQDISDESLEEFKSEVHMMKRLRHPNIVLFMGAVAYPPNLSIVTEFLPRGSLYRLIHRSNHQLDERRRLRMAFDAARGMNYLHNCSPVIVHRDLKSLNLLVDRNWVVKVCDFGLSQMKYSTFLSSRSMAGTAEWMAPEVLRSEPSNEKCDVYSFGVILWELCTLQQPWGGMNPMQVVGAVGFQHRRLDIPDHIDPAIADIIRNCWETDPRLRPSFVEIMAALKPFQKHVTAAQVPRHSST